MQEIKPLDPQSFCPGGREKKIKNCCSDIQKELDQINRMFQGKQYAACLAFVEKLAEKFPDRSCLKFIQCTLLRELGRNEDALAIAEPWAANEPDNVRACSELASIHTTLGNLEKAIDILIDVFEKSDSNSMRMEPLETAFMLAIAMANSGLTISAIPLLHFLAKFPVPEIQQQASNYYRQILSESQIPLLYQLLVPGAVPAETFPELDKYEEALTFAYSARWKKALAQLLSLEPLGEQFGAIYRDIAILYFWLGNIEKGLPYLEKYITMPDTSEEDAVEARLLQWYMENRFWEDDVPYIQKAYWPIQNSNTALENLLSDKRIAVLEVDPAQFQEENSPPPQKVFGFLDKPFNTVLSEEEKKEFPPQLRTIFTLFGKQTDRDARIEVFSYPADELGAFEKNLRTLLNGDLGDRTIVNQAEYSWTERNMIPEFYPPAMVSYSAAERLALEQNYLENVFLPEWITRPSGLLGGKSPKDAANDPSLRISLLAAVERFRNYLPEGDEANQFIQKLRSQLNLPEVRQITFPADTEEKDLQLLINHVPVWRWYNIDFDALSTSILCVILDNAFALGQNYVSSRIAKILLERNDPLSVQVRSACFQLSITDSIRNGNFEKAHDLLKQVYEEAKKADLSDGRWNLLEINLLIAEGKPEAVMGIMQHITMNHRNELDVMEGLQMIMQRLGIGPGSGAPGSQSAPTAPVFEPEQKPASTLWTPGSSNDSNGNAGPSKLWTPD
ncbi:MAG: hypothetical protein Q4G69_01480 [Planctomycetia bacterium]|nr:hypothetical protein [Planctomycetia bacterium]